MADDLWQIPSLNACNLVLSWEIYLETRRFQRNFCQSYDEIQPQIFSRDTGSSAAHHVCAERIGLFTALLRRQFSYHCCSFRSSKF